MRVSIEVPHPRPAVYEYLDVLANHELFTDHMMRKWRCDGPERGVGAKARVEVTLGGRTDQVVIEVIEATAPTTSVERNVGAGGRRIATGTYLLDELPGGGTRVNFEYALRRAPWSEQIASPLVRAVMRRTFQRAMERLAEQLHTRERAGPRVSAEEPS